MSVYTNGLRAVFTPLDSVYTPGPTEACTMILKEMTRSAEITFERAGEASIVIEGIGEGPSVDGSEEVHLERAVVVVE
jgi:hypothetical protein